MMIWLMYSAGVLACLLSKMGVYVKRHAGASGVWGATKEWFDVTVVEDKVSWVVTIVVCYLLGLSYIENITFGFFEITGFLPSLPKHSAVAALVGFLAEALAPGLACKLLKIKDSWLEVE